MITTILLFLVALFGAPAVVEPQSAPARAVRSLSAEDDRFLEDLSRRTFMFFWEQADPVTGIVRDRSRTDGKPVNDVGSIAAVGFGLSGLCIAAERGWLPRSDVIARARTTLRFFAEKMEHERGWFFHFVNLRTGAREWKSELSSIDTALLLAGVLTARQCFAADADVVRYAETIYLRVDFRWMLAGHETLLSHGWRPESGFLASRWSRYCELMILYLLAIASPAHSLSDESWYAWTRPVMTFDKYRYISHADPLFVHQYSHAWVDFRGRRERRTGTDWFENSVTATHAHRAFCLSLAKEFPGYTEHIWGITASDSQKGYVAWGGPPRHEAIDGSVVPAAAAGSLMFAPDITLPALREMRARFGDRIYGRYGFADAFHPTSGWVNPDVIGIDLGITLLSAENLRSGSVWKWFMQNREIAAALDRVMNAERPQVTPVTGIGPMHPIAHAIGQRPARMARSRRPGRLCLRDHDGDSDAPLSRAAAVGGDAAHRTSGAGRRRRCRSSRERYAHRTLISAVRARCHPSGWCLANRGVHRRALAAVDLPPAR